MKQSETLFDVSPPAQGPHVPYQRCSATSKAAAERIAPHAGAQEQQVLDAIRSARDHGLTRQEIADALVMRLQSVCGRVDSLIKKVRVYENGRRDGRAVLMAKEQ